MSTNSTNFRLPQWLRVSSLLASLAVMAAPAFAQHEIDSDAERSPIVISGNENAFGYSQMAQMAIMQKLQGANRYPRQEAVDLQNAIAAREDVPANYVLQSPGSGPILVMTALAFAEPGKNVVTVEPGYTQLTNAFQEHGGEVKKVPLNDDLQYDLDAIKDAMDENTAVVYICNPNNPTGTIVDPVKLTQFIMSAPKDVLIFVDEAYLELAPGGLEKNSMVKLVKQRKNLIIARTFSKVFGMAGLRIGYGISQPETLEKLKAYYMGGPSILSTVAATAALQDQDFFDFSVESYHNVRSMVKDRLDELGLEYAEPNGSFIFIHTGVPIDELQARMAEEQIQIGRPFPPMLDWARVSIGTEEEMQVFLETFEKVMKEYGKIAA